VKTFRLKQNPGVEGTRLQLKTIPTNLLNRRTSSLSGQDLHAFHA
jgi:hypothetical protein